MIYNLYVLVYIRVSSRFATRTNKVCACPAISNFASTDFPIIVLVDTIL